MQMRLQTMARGQSISSGAVPKSAAGAGDVNAIQVANPQCILIEMDGETQAQIQGLLQYAKCIDLGLNTSSIESAITAVIPA